MLVLALHALAWQLAFGSLPRFAPARAGVRALAVVSVPQGGQVPSARPIAAVVALQPARRPDPRTSPTSPSLARPTAAARERPPARVTPASRAPAGAGGSTARAAPASPSERWPVYATRAPPSTTLRYALVQAPIRAASAPVEGEATLAWTNADGAFALRLVTSAAGRPPREWESTGRFDGAGVAPGRLVERERGRDRRAVTFDHDGARVRFSSAPGAPPIAPGAQDRWSWMAQLAAIVEAGASGGGRRTAPAGPWTLQVAGLRGDVERWTFRVLPPADPPRPQGNDVSAPAGQAPGLLHVLRDSERPYDLRIEAWLSPALHHFPAALRMSTPPGPWAVTLALAGEPEPGP